MSELRHTAVIEVLDGTEIVIDVRLSQPHGWHDLQRIVQAAGEEFVNQFNEAVITAKRRARS